MGMLLRATRYHGFGTNDLGLVPSRRTYIRVANPVLIRDRLRFCFQRRRSDSQCIQSASCQATKKPDHLAMIRLELGALRQGDRRSAKHPSGASRHSVRQLPPCVLVKAEIIGRQFFAPRNVSCRKVYAKGNLAIPLIGVRRIGMVEESPVVAA